MNTHLSNSFAHGSQKMHNMRKEAGGNTDQAGSVAGVPTNKYAEK